MNLTPENLKIVKIVVQEFFPDVTSETVAESLLKVVLKFVDGQTNLATTRLEIRLALGIEYRREAETRYDLCAKTAHALSWGYTHWKEDQFTQADGNPYSALRFYDCFHHAEPVEWLKLWQTHGGRIFGENEMIALKNDPIWTKLSAFHLPFPPFDFGSGMDVERITSDMAEKLGFPTPKTLLNPTTLDLNFGPALGKRLNEYLSATVQREIVEIAIRQGTATVLLNLVRERLGPLDTVSTETAPDIIRILSCALEKGFGEQFSYQSVAYELLVRAYAAVNMHDEANCYRERHLECLSTWLESGISFDWDQRSRTYGLAAEICGQLNRPEQASAYRKLELENRDGFSLLSDAIEKLRNCGPIIPKETGAAILNLLTKAAERIPQKYPSQHAQIFRSTGEILEAWGDTTKAIEYYEFALQTDPKSGVKRRLDKLHKLSPKTSSPPTTQVH